MAGPTLGEPMPEGLTQDEAAWWYSQQEDLRRQHEAAVLSPGPLGGAAPRLGDPIPEGLTEEEAAWWQARQEQLTQEAAMTMSPGPAGGLGGVNPSAALTPPGLTEEERSWWLHNHARRREPTTPGSMVPGDVLPEGMTEAEQGEWVERQRGMLEEQYLRDMVDSNIKMDGGEGEGMEGVKEEENEGGVLFVDSPGPTKAAGLGPVTPGGVVERDEENVDPQNGLRQAPGTPGKVPFASPTPSDKEAGLD